MDKVKFLLEVNQPAKKQNNNKQTTNKFGPDLLPTDSNRVVFADFKINCFFSIAGFPRRLTPYVPCLLQV